VALAVAPTLRPVAMGARPLRFVRRMPDQKYRLRYQHFSPWAKANASAPTRCSWAPPVPLGRSLPALVWRRKVLRSARSSRLLSRSYWTIELRLGVPGQSAEVEACRDGFSLFFATSTRRQGRRGNARRCFSSSRFLSSCNESAWPRKHVAHRAPQVAELGFPG